MKPAFVAIAFTLLLMALPSAWAKPDPSATQPSSKLPDAHLVGTGWTEIFPGVNYDLPPQTTGRHTWKDGVDHFYVLDGDPSTFPGRDSGCRAEARIYNDYSSGQAQFSADVMVEPGTNNVSIFQIFGNTGHATTCMIWASHNGCLSHYGDEILAKDVYNK